MKKLNRYDLLALGIIVVSTLLSLKRLNIFPVFVDIFYHMSTAKGFDIAGGVVLHDFWGVCTSWKNPSVSSSPSRNNGFYV